MPFDAAGTEPTEPLRVSLMAPSVLPLLLDLNIVLLQMHLYNPFRFGQAPQR
jgi:hypothetical protein